MGNTTPLFPSSFQDNNPSTRSQQQQNPNRLSHSGGEELVTTAFDPRRESLLQLTVTDAVEMDVIEENVAWYSEESGRNTNNSNYNVSSTINPNNPNNNTPSQSFPLSPSPSLPPLYPSISTLKEYYKIKKSGYCTNQHIYYLIFNGCENTGLKGQFGVRKMLGKRFNEEEVLSILKTFLSGLLVYMRKFKRNIQKIDLDDIGFQQVVYNNSSNERGNDHYTAYTTHNHNHSPPHTTNNHNPNPNHILNHPYHPNTNNHPQALITTTLHPHRPIRMFMIQPWLKEKRQQQTLSVNQVNILLQNPSPQRLQQQAGTSTYTTNIFTQPDHTNNINTSNNNTTPPSNNPKLSSLLFSVGVIGLKLLEMGFVDDVYVRVPRKGVDVDRVKAYLGRFGKGMGREGENDKGRQGKEMKGLWVGDRGRGDGDGNINSNKYLGSYNNTSSNNTNNYNYTNSNNSSNNNNYNNFNQPNLTPNPNNTTTTPPPPLTYTTSSLTKQKLLSGLSILLLSQTPKDRQRIYDHWGVDLKETYHLQRSYLFDSGEEGLDEHDGRMQNGGRGINDTAINDKPRVDRPTPNIYTNDPNPHPTTYNNPTTFTPQTKLYGMQQQKPHHLTLNTNNNNTNSSNINNNNTNHGQSVWQQQYQPHQPPYHKRQQYVYRVDQLKGGSGGSGNINGGNGSKMGNGDSSYRDNGDSGWVNRGGLNGNYSNNYSNSSPNNHNNNNNFNNNYNSNYVNNYTNNSRIITTNNNNNNNNPTYPISTSTQPHHHPIPHSYNPTSLPPLPQTHSPFLPS